MKTNLMWKTMALNVISQPIGATVKLSTIIKIRKYRGLHERHHFIRMVIEVHDTSKHDMDHFRKECVFLFHNRWSRDHLFLSFCIQFFKQRVSLTFQCALTSTIKRKIALAKDVYSRPPITFKSHDLHTSDIRGVVSEIISYHKKV